MAYKLSVIHEKPTTDEVTAGYDPFIEGVAMPIASFLDDMEARGIIYASDAIGPFTVNKAGTKEQISFSVKTDIE